MKFLLLLIYLISSPVWALEVPPLTRPVEDLAQLLKIDEKEQIEKEIRNIYENKQAQISILIIDSLEEENLEEYSIKVAETWKLGTEKEDNGVLILLAMKERKIRIEVGNGIEGAITDLASSRMIDSMGPYMRAGEYGKALLQTVDKIKELIEFNTPEAIAQRKAEAELLAKQRDESLKAIANGFVWVLNGVILFLALNWFYFFLFSSKKEKKELMQESKKIADDIVKVSEQVEKTKEELSKVAVDKEKYNYLKKVEQVESLEAEKSRLTSNILTMKKYLGE